MARIRSFMEMRPAEMTPVMRRFEPFENVKTLRYKWFNWFWIGDCKGDVGNYTIMVGPFLTRGRARNAWQNPLLVQREQDEQRSRRDFLNKWEEEDDPQN